MRAHPPTEQQGPIYHQLGPLLVVRMVGFCERTNELAEELQPRMLLSGEDQIRRLASELLGALDLSVCGDRILAGIESSVAEGAYSNARPFVYAACILLMRSVGGQGDVTQVVSSDVHAWSSTRLWPILLHVFTLDAVDGDSMDIAKLQRGSIDAAGLVLRATHSLQGNATAESAAISAIESLRSDAGACSCIVSAVASALLSWPPCAARDSFCRCAKSFAQRVPSSVDVRLLRRVLG